VTTVQYNYYQYFWVFFALPDVFAHFTHSRPNGRLITCLSIVKGNNVVELYRHIVFLLQWRGRRLCCWQRHSGSNARRDAVLTWRDDFIHVFTRAHHVDHIGWTFGQREHCATAQTSCQPYHSQPTL